MSRTCQILGNAYETRAMRIARRRGRALELRHLDQRWWMCKSCGWDPNNPVIWDWWIRLHWRTRETVYRMSRWIWEEGDRSGHGFPARQQSEAGKCESISTPI